MENESRKPGGRWWREPEFYCLILVVLAAHFFRLDLLSIRGEESRRFAIGWEMLQSGDWIVTRVQGQPVFYRPPLQNWLLGFSAWVCGSCEPWVVRLPGALATLATALLLYVYCRRFMSPLGAFASGAVLATMAQVLELGRLAETESLFMLLVTGSLLLWHWGYVHGWRDISMWTAAYFVAGLGMLAKGFQAPIYLGAATVLFLLLSGKWRRIFTWGHLAGLAVFCLVYAAWFIPYWVEMGSEAARRMFLFDFANHVEGSSGIRHLIEFPLEVMSCMLPWSVLLLAYASRTLRRSLGEARPMVTFTVTAVAATFPSCWLSAGGAPRYWMVMYPCLACLIGLVVQRGAEAAAESRLRRRWTLFLTLFGVLMAGAAVLAVVASWPGIAPSRFSQPFLQALFYGVVVGGLAFLILVWRGQAGGFSSPRLAAFLPVLALMLFVALSYSVWVLNYQHGKSFDIAAEVDRFKHAVPPGARLVSFGQVNHRFAYYYGKSIAELPWPEKSSDLPGDLDYFCFDCEHLSRPLPVSWKKVTEIICERFPTPTPTVMVIVGRVEPPAPGTEQSPLATQQAAFRLQADTLSRRR